MSSPRILLTGVFDVLHVGHVRLINAAAQYGGKVTIGINDDDSVRWLKGPTRPVNCEEDRAEVLRAFANVESVFIIPSVVVVDAILAIRPEFWVKGSDYTLETLNQDEVAAARKVGSEIVLLPLTKGYSTTATLKKMESK